MPTNERVASMRMMKRMTKIVKRMTVKKRNTITMRVIVIWKMLALHHFR